MAVNQFERNSRPVRPRRVGSYDPLRGMSPGQSRAMAGNTGLAGLNERDVYKLQAGTERAGNKMSFADLGRAANEMGSKYRRPVQVNKSFFGDDSGRQVTPSMLNSQGNFMPFTATLPNFSPLFGDASRAFTGYNSLKYPATGPMPKGQNQNTMFMQNTPGMMSGVMDYVTGGGMLGKTLGGIQNFLAPMNPMPVINEALGSNKLSSFDSFMQSGQGFNMVLAGLNPQQRRIYDLAITVPGTTREDALRKAKSFQRMAMGGISSLN
jgi:hypothetical protein